MTKSTPYYELHITVENIQDYDSNVMQDVLNEKAPDWKFSNITDDIVLGPGPKMYATRNYPITVRLADVKNSLEITGKILSDANLSVVRSKIECVIFDVVHKN